MKKKDTFNEMIDKVISNSPPSVLIKARFLGKTINGYTFGPSDCYTFVNIQDIDESYEIFKPEEYRVYHSPSNTTIYHL